MDCPPLLLQQWPEKFSILENPNTYFTPAFVKLTSGFLGILKGSKVDSLLNFYLELSFRTLPNIPIELDRTQKLFLNLFCDKIYSLVLCIIHYTLFLWNLQQRSFTMFSWENNCSGVIAQQIKVATQSYCTTVVTAALPRKLETSWKIRTISNSFKVAPSAALLFNFLSIS